MKKVRSFAGFTILFTILFIYFVDQNRQMHSSNQEMNHHLQQVTIPDGHPVPSVKAWVTQDPSGSWLLKIETTNFTITPEKAGQNGVSYDEGHAHIYVNGKKINRLYGHYYHLGSLEKGVNQIKVSLTSNNHGTFFHNGEEIADTTTVMVP